MKESPGSYGKILPFNPKYAVPSMRAVSQKKLQILHFVNLLLVSPVSWITYSLGVGWWLHHLKISTVNCGRLPGRYCWKTSPVRGRNMARKGAVVTRRILLGGSAMSHRQCFADPCRPERECRYEETSPTCIVFNTTAYAHCAETLFDFVELCVLRKTFTKWQGYPTAYPDKAQ